MWRALTAALLLGGSMVPATAVAASDSRVFAFADPRINESSGLVDLGSLMVTTNDSGSPSVLFVVSPVTGRTVGVTDFHATTVDVEALAPAGGRAVWVGDIGDNRGNRKSVSVFKVRVAPGRVNARPTRYRLVYPGGARNAESLFADGRGRLYVVTKSILGGTVYRAPLRLSRTRPNRLQPVGRVLEYATDAAMLPDRRHVVVRGPERASVYTFPAFKRVGSFALPRQRQGEGISVGPGSRIRLSSEGARSAVQQIALPAAVVQLMRPVTTPAPSASASPSPSPSARPTATDRPRPDGDRQDDQLGDLDPWLMWSIPGVIALGALGIGLGLRRRSE
ncbi:MAG: hypothetical protein JWR85_651 [Marmoricola sp.]|nr:hypothetical protein [Marmoricola sp.]